ncbi:MAG: protein jag [Patescibacteria group bacterium]
MVNEDTIKNLGSELLDKIGIDYNALDVEKEGDTFRINIQTEKDGGILIGYHGENLNSFQRILSMMLFNEEEEWIPILVDVDGYRDETRQRLEEMAENVAQRVRFLRDTVSLSPMNSYERRIVHMKVAELSGVHTKSVGEGRNRRVTIRPGEGSEDEASSK